MGKWQRDELSALLGRSWEQLPGEQPRQKAPRIRTMPEGGSYGSSWAKPVITPFDSNHWVDRESSLSSVVILSAAGFPMMSAAIRLEQVINSYPDASLSWEPALIG